MLGPDDSLNEKSTHGIYSNSAVVRSFLTAALQAGLQVVRDEEWTQEDFIDTLAGIDPRAR